MDAARALAEAARTDPDAPALVEGDRTITYGAWDTLADAAAARLRDAGVGPGDLVCVGAGAGLVYPVLCLGALRAGAVVCGVNPRLGSTAVAEILGRLAPALTIAERSGGGLDADGSWLEPTQAATEPVPRQPDDPAVVVLTGGTTGAPKGATFTHRALDWLASAHAGVGTGTGARRVVATPPTQTGFMTRIVGIIRQRETLVFLPRWRAADVLDAAVRHRVTALGGVPAQWVLLLDELGRRPRRLPDLRIALAGGAPVPSALTDEVRARLGVPCVVRYSCTEAGVISGTRPDDDPAEVRGTAGRPAPGVEVRLDDPSDGVGEIACRSPGLMSGYWRDGAATASAMAGGWLRTGDLGRLDGRGNLVVCGRRTEMYLRGGYNVFPAVVEDALRRHPSVLDAAVVGVPDLVLGERGVAFVVVRGPAPDAQALRALVGRLVADYAAPDAVEVVGELPRTAAGKTDKQALLRRISAT